jgi:uncharacterized protein (DUF849 family)
MFNMPAKFHRGTICCRICAAPALCTRTFATQSALLGGNVRVGLEDSLYIDRGELSTSNAQQVLKIRAIIEALGLEAATPTEARALLKLKGRDQVKF